ncbi:hypothetical protein [Bacteroides ovatus]|jgi:hypothetical protein|uniref:Uncharacterized protein n=1 Tax=Siphoviridae sp. ctyjS2 TaxID=2827284 RepID=A0A8S5R3F0_9CAUD|nr:MAG TPA: hypothetical protein [Siphoviridae sp. ctyjS2]
MDFNVNVNVKFDATPALVGAVSTLAGVIKPAEVLKPTVASPAIPMLEAKELVAKEEVNPEPEHPSASVPETPSQQAASAVQEKKSDEITDEMLRKIVGPVSKTKGKEAVFAILDEFGVKRVPDLNQEQRQAFIDKVNAL